MEGIESPMKRNLMIRILSMLLMASMLLVEVGSTLAYALEQTEVPPQTEAEEGAEAETPEENFGTEQQEPPEQPEDVPEEGQVPETPQEEEGTTPEETPETPDETEAGDGGEEPAAPEADEGVLGGEDPTEAETPEEPLEDEDAEGEEELTPEQQAEQTAMAELETLLQQAMALHASDTSYSYATELAKFPASYQSYLKALHTNHPNWIFVAVDTGLEWDAVINGELGAASTIEYTYSDLLLNNHTGYYSTSGYTNTNGYKPIDSSHVSCSRAAIAYYMDPRNFLTDKYIFMFEDQEFNKTVQKLTGVQTILKNANSTSTGLYHMQNYVTTSGSTATLASLKSSYGSDYSSIIYNVGLAVGISPYFLASKIVQETGATTTNGSISGKYSYNGVSYTGYYNFYNIGAYASATGGAIANGLSYAKNKGWSNPILSISGGAKYIYDQYVGMGQNTSYYMRFNVSPESTRTLYTHQYMSAIYAVASEASKTYTGYSNVGAVDNAFLFYIPVFRNMPDKTAKVTLTPTTTGKTNTSCGLYVSPSTSATKTATIPSGATVTVLGGNVTTSEVYSSRLVHPYWYQVKVTISGTSYTGYVDEENVDLSAVYHITKGSTKNLSSVLSTSGSAGTLYYETSDPAVATVSDKGLITATGNGSCTIYVISGGGSFDAVGLKVSSAGSSTNDTEGGVPATPSITAVSNLNGSVRVTWGAVSGATGYALYRKAGSATAWQRIATISSGSTVLYNDTNVTNNTVYTYTLRAMNQFGASDFDRVGTQTRYLQVPSLTQAKAYADGVAVQWATVTGATSYDLYSAEGSGSWSKVATLTAVSGSVQGYTDGTAVKGKTYRYTVRANYGSYRSYYNTSGIQATAITTNPVLNCIANGTLNYRTGAGTSYAAAGSFASGALVQVVPGTSVSVSGAVWYQVRVNGGSIYYVNSAYLYMTPVLKQAVNINGAIRITWQEQSKATGYYVYRKTSTTGWTRLDSVITAQFDDKTAVSGTTYYYTVRAAYGTKVSDFVRSGISCYCLSTPSLTSAKASGNAIQVTWGKVAAASGYCIYRKTASSGWSLLAVVSASKVSYADASADFDVTYTYTVRAYKGSTLSSFISKGVSAKLTSANVTLENQVAKAATKYYKTASASGTAAGTLAANTVVKVVSGWSQTAGGVTWRKIQVGGAYYYAPASNLLATPVLTSAANVPTGVRVQWTQVSSGTGYAVYRKTAGTSWARIATINSNSTILYNDTKAISGVTYIYTVRAFYGSVMSQYDTKGISCLCLATPSLTSAKAASSGITVSWSKVTGATGYRVYRKTATSSWERIAVCTGTSYQDSQNLSAGTTYCYTVRAYQGTTLSSYQVAGISAVAAASSVTLVNYVTTGMLNYRSSPDKTSSSNIVGTLASGTTVKIVSGWSKTVDDTTWFKCYINGNYYYLSSKYLKKA